MIMKKVFILIFISIIVIFLYLLVITIYNKKFYNIECHYEIYQGGKIIDKVIKEYNARLSFKDYCSNNYSDESAYWKLVKKIVTKA